MEEITPQKPSLINRLKTKLESFNTTRPTLFHSARLKLTGFYLAIIIIFSLMLTLSIRTLAQLEFDHAGIAQRGVVHQLLYDIYSVPPNPDNDFLRFQSDQDSTVRRHLNEDVIMLNIFALIVGGVLSYWYAGRTLKPIEEAHEAQARFTADASHELRTPLASLQLENEVFLRQKNFTQADAREVIKSNLEEVQRLESLAGNLLALTQYEKASLELSPIDISAVVTEACQRATDIAEPKKIALEIQVPKELVIGHADSLVELVGIVLDNAIKFSPRHSSVFINGIKAGNRFHISIRDEGEGITETDLPLIFDRLYRGDKSRTKNTPGYGLGLSLAREIATANRGSITARNYPTGGAQFVISLLLAKQPKHNP
ncbi:MAG: ATP-binding protein [Candidatus Saccharimonadales bacterium]|jgi:signal transduction histidine kinase